MSLRQHLPHGALAIRRNKVRSALTMLGVIIGVASVIAMIALGSGARAAIDEQIQSQGTNVIYVSAGSFGGRAAARAAGAGPSRPSRSRTPWRSRARCPSVARWTPVRRAAARRSSPATQNWATPVEGGNEDYVVIRNWPIAERRQLHRRATSRCADKVCLLGDTVAKTLFPGEDPVGQIMRVKNLPFRVLGVLAPKGQGQFGRGPGRHRARALHDGPEEAARDHLHPAGRRSLARSRDAVEQTAVAITRLMRAAPPHPEPGEDDFSVRTVEEMAADARADGQHHDRPADERRLGQPAGGRDRDHEHHAGLGHRAHPRDRPAHGRGRRTGDILRQFLAEAIALSLLGGAGRHRARRRRSRQGSRAAWAGRPRSRAPRSCSPSRSRPRSASSSATTRPARPPASTRSTRCATSDGLESTACPPRSWLAALAAVAPRTRWSSGPSPTRSRLAPHRATDLVGRRIVANVCETLVRVRARALAPRGVLATAWATPTSASGRFTLREGVRFHDGAPLDADAVVANLENLRRERGFPGHAERLGPLVVAITLDQPNAALLATLSQPFFAMQSPQRARGRARAPVGTGPFRLAPRRPGLVELEANDGYWGGAPRLRHLRFRRFPSEDALVARARSPARSDVSSALGPERVAELRDARGLTLDSQTGLNLAFLAINNERPVLGRARAPGAVARRRPAPRSSREILGGHGEPARNPLPPSLWGYDARTRELVLDRAPRAGCSRRRASPTGFETTLTVSRRAASLPARAAARWPRACATTWRRSGSWCGCARSTAGPSTSRSRRAATTTWRCSAGRPTRSTRTTSCRRSSTRGRSAPRTAAATAAPAWTAS